MARSVSFCLPQEVDVRALRTLMEESALSLVNFVCSPKFRLGSIVSPRILGFLAVGMVVLLMERLSVTLRTPMTCFLLPHIQNIM